MFERVMKVLDWIAIPVGLTALLCNFLLPDEGGWACISRVSCVAAGILGAIYLLYAIVLWFFKRPKFDWHLINGHFLYKVCCLVLLMPSLLASIVLCCSDISTPKELAYEDALYENRDRGLTCCIEHKQESPNIYWSVYYHFIDPGNQHMTTTKGGRAWAAVIAVFGMFLLNGLLVSSIIGYVDRRKEKWIKGEVRYKWFLKRSPHYVIIGGNDMVEGIVKQFLGKICEDKCFWARFSRPYILVQTSRDVEEFRRELFSTLNEEKQKNIIIYYGSRTSKKDIEELYIESANEVYVLGEETRTDDLESYHDTMNMECLNLLLRDYQKTTEGQKISAMLPQVRTYREQLEKVVNKEQKEEIEKSHADLNNAWKERIQLKCCVMFEYQTTFSVFQFYDIDENVDAYIEFRPFNYYEMWAQKVLINKEIDPERIKANADKGAYLPLEGAEGIKINDEKHVHLFVVGMSRMGTAMGIEAAHLAHYPNYEQKKIRSKITFIDKNAAEEKDFFMGRFKELFALSHWRYGDVENDNLAWKKTHVPFNQDYLGGDFLDIEWEFINGGVEQAAVQDYILASSTPFAKVTIAICLPESNRSHAAALYLQKKIYESESILQVLVYNRYGNAIVKAIGDSGPVYPYKGKIKSFGSAESCLVDNYMEASENIGKRIGDVYKESADIKNITYIGKSKSASRWSNIYNGNMLWTKLRCTDFFSPDFICNSKIIDSLADVEHNRWVVEQLLMNFRPLSSEEQEDMILCGRSNKNVLKAQMAHLDICSNQRLLEIDKDARKYDIDLTMCLFGILNSM